jgi:hypothetical protein
MTTIEIPESERVDVWGVSYRIHCKSCNLIWEVFVPFGEPLPDLWDACTNCIAKMQGAFVMSKPEDGKYKYTKVLAKYPFLNRG